MHNILEIIQNDFAKMHNNNWDDYRFFLHVARGGSLTAASETLRVNQSTVFRRIKQFEEKVEARLFERSQAGYSLTQAGEDILAKVASLEEEIFAIDREIFGENVMLSGTIKISTSDTIGYFWLPDYVAEFHKQYPDILLDIDITSHHMNLSKREADLVISTANVHPDTMVGRTLSPIIFRLYASSQYREEHGELLSIEQHDSHKFLLPNDKIVRLKVAQWMRQKIPLTQIAFMSDKLTGLYNACLQHMGIALLPHYVGDRDDRLVTMAHLPKQFEQHIWMLTHYDMRNTLRIKTFMQFMQSHSR